MSLERLRKQGGFTLLELLIIVVIIGILGLLIIPNIIDAPKKNRETQRKTDLRGIQKGLEDYFVANNSYPTSPSVAPVSFFRRENSRPVPVDCAFSAAMIRKRNG